MLCVALVNILPGAPAVLVVVLSHSPGLAEMNPSMSWVSHTPTGSVTNCSLAPGCKASAGSLGEAAPTPEPAAPALYGVHLRQLC